MKSKTNRALVVFSGILTLINFILHYGATDGMLYLEVIESSVKLHQEVPVFERRMLLTKLLLFTKQFTPISLLHGFVIINYTALFFCFIILGKISILIHNNLKIAFINISFFAFSFSILFAFFHPTYTYDDLLAYLWILLSFYFLIQNKLLWVIFYFTIAVLTRETSIILIIPFYYLHSKFFTYKSLLVNKFFKFSIPVLVYLVYRVILWRINGTQWEMEEWSFRFSGLKDNFLNYERTVETITMFLVHTLLPIILIFNVHTLASSKEFIHKKNAFLLAIILNTFVVLLFASARESRLFMLPLLIISPWIGSYLLIKNYNFQLSMKWLVLIVSYILFYGFAFYVYAPTIRNGENGLFQWYVYFYFMFCISLFVFSKDERPS